MGWEEGWKKLGKEKRRRNGEREKKKGIDSNIPVVIEQYQDRTLV